MLRKIGNNKAITVTMDGVTISVLSKSYLVVTVHFINGYEIQCVILGAFVLTEVNIFL